jgi:hypothetical protein
MRENPLGTFIIILALLVAIERVVVAFINRNKPIMQGGSTDADDDDDSSEEDDES